MKKNSVMVKQVLMSIVTAGIMTFGFTACSDELSMENNEGAPSTEDIRSMRLEQYSYSVPVRVNAEGDWKVDLRFDNEDRQFCYVYPDHGHGPATVSLYVLDNYNPTHIILSQKLPHAGSFMV